MIGARCKLAAMGIWFVTIGANRMCNRRFEISLHMAGHALDFQMLSQQGEVRPRVIEFCFERGLLPRGCGMALGAILLEGPLVRIAVACAARREGNAGIPRSPVGSCRVALFALHLHVHSSQRKSGLRVVEALLIQPRSIPALGGVTPCAIGPEPPLVLVFVTCGASRGKTKIGMIEILVLQQSAHALVNVLCIMTVAARHAGMLPIQHVSGLRMIEARWCRRPVHDRKVRPVVIGVTFYARGARHARLRIRCMKSVMMRKLACNFSMAVEAEERAGSHRGCMAAGAILRPFQRLMCARERPWRNLRRGNMG